jgi:hypothetical protein
MTGPELFRESLSLAYDGPGCACETTCCIHEQVQLQRAQVLATLALAAATALAGVTLTLPASNSHATEWNRAIGITRDEEKAS